MPYLKMLWQTESPTPQVGSWDYWTSVEKVLFTDSTGSSVTKSNKKIAYYAVAYTTASNYRPVLVSPDPDAVSYNSYSGEKTYNGTITDSNGIVWYYNSLQAVGLYFSNRPDFCINNTPCALTDAQQIAQDLLDRIYAVPFQHDFNVGQTYNMDITCSNMTFARKAIGIFLFKFISEYGTSVSYTALSNNVDTILNHFFDSNLVNFISLSIERIGGSADSIRLNSFFSDDTNPHTSYRISAAKDTISGFDYYFGRFDGFTYQGRYRRTDILSDGTITYSTPSASIAGFTIGVRIPDSSTYLLTSSNIGIDL